MKRKPTRKLNFTKRALEAIPVPPKGKQTIVFDTKTEGLGLFVFHSGRRSFFHRRFADGVASRTKLGRYPAFSIEQARGKAAELNAKLEKWKSDQSDSKGPNPLAKNSDRTQATFADLIDAYIRVHVAAHANNPTRAEQNLRWMMKKYLSPWSARRIDAIRIEDVLTLRNAIGVEHRYQANRVVEVLKAIFNWSAGRKDGKVNFWPVANPARDVELYPEEKRKRFLQPEELAKFNDELRTTFRRQSVMTYAQALAFEAEFGVDQCDDRILRIIQQKIRMPQEGEQRPDLDLHDFLTVALATGARRSNVLAMRWSDISFERANWHIPFSKSGEGYDVPLTPAALDVLKRRAALRDDGAVFVFPGRSESGHIIDLKKQWDAFRKRAGIPDIRIHDLRRTKGSYMAISGVSLQQIGAVLGHKSLGSTEIYARLHQESIRQAIESGDAAMERMMKQAKKRLKLATRKGSTGTAPKKLGSGRP